MPTLDAASTTGPQVSANQNAGFALSHTVTTSGARRALVVFVSYFDGSLTIADIDWGGTSFSEGLIAAIGTASTEGRVEAWLHLNPATGTNDVGVTYSAGGAMDEIGLMASSWLDVNQTTPTDETDTDGPGNGTLSTLTITTLGTNNVFVGGTYAFVGSTQEINSSDTVLTQGSCNGSISGQESQYSTDTSHNWTYVAAMDYLSVGIELVDDDGSGGGAFNSVPTIMQNYRNMGFKI